METRKLKLKKTGEIRTRFAPSPTGFFHIGGARTALFNYLFAKQNQGSFILRIEDTDLERSKPEFEKDIIESLKWLGIEWTEGPDIGGNYGPYRQSERSDIYEKYLKKLLEEKKAYYCFCSEEELEAKRQDQISRGVALKYDGKCSSLTKKETSKNLEENKNFVIRFRVPDKKVVFDDIIRGKIEVDVSLIGDFVISKTFKTPLFYLAGVIDDYEMKVSHIIRGEEHISNTPKQLLIQEALGFPRPIYAHLPLILAPDRSKLSKRHGAVSVQEYKKQGYLSETLINFLALLGWNPGTEKEFFSLNSLVKEFSLEQVQKAGAIFNQKRLDFLNGFYIRHKSLEKLTELCLSYLIESKLIDYKNGEQKIPRDLIVCETKETILYETLEKIIFLYQTRIKKLAEISEFADFFFKEKLEYGPELLKWQKMSDKDLFDSLNRLEEIISEINEKNWDLKNLENVLLLEAEKMPDRGSLLWPLRVALTGKEHSAGPFEIAEILGKNKVLERIKEAKKVLSFKL